METQRNRTVTSSTSRAADELRRAAASLCPGCRRETKTVEGVCADCWEPKEKGARVLRPQLRRTPVFDFDFDEIWISAGIVVVAGVLLRLLLAVLGLW